MTAIPTPEPDDNFLGRRYLVALALVALLILVDQALIQPPLYELTSDAPVINIAGRQRMLGQRLTKAALELDRGVDEKCRDRILGQMAAVLSRWREAHEGLRFGNESLSLPGRNSDAVALALEKIEPTFRLMSEAASRMLKDKYGPDPVPHGSNVNLATILENEEDYLFQMERMVSLYEAEARARVEGLRETGWVVTALILVALVGIGLFILGPAAQLIRRQFTELRETRNALEMRVTERTIELEWVNLELQRGADERSQADARHRALIEQFSHVARTSTVGEMATGLAHELNQPLGAVANYVEGCMVALERPDPPLGEIRDALGKALNATLRTGEIIRRIRQFVNRHPPEVESFAPNRVVEEVEALLQDEARRNRIALKLHLAPELPSMIGDPIQIQQVLVNLVQNAMESISVLQPTMPTVVMETRLTDTGEVEFAVTDNGEGIPADRIGRVFESYFSTRAEGMGMGLAISRTIIEAHLGRINVESIPAVRTTFRFTLPKPAGTDGGTDRLHRR